MGNARFLNTHRLPVVAVSDSKFASKLAVSSMRFRSSGRSPENRSIASRRITWLDALISWVTLRGLRLSNIHRHGRLQWRESKHMAVLVGL
jgi:hypothetical protein